MAPRRKYHLSPDQLLAAALRVASLYNGNLTLRQLYYRLLALGHISLGEDPSEDKGKAYKRFGGIIADARLRGDFPFEWLLDRTRDVQPGSFKTNKVVVPTALAEAEKEILTAPERLLLRSRWWGQETLVSVWVEKEALAGVFEKPCRDTGVSWFVCRGYPSLSSLYDWVKYMDECCRLNTSVHELVILYFGDHDPDGWEIPRSAHRRVCEIAELYSHEFQNIFYPRLERVAFNMDQILAFDPPSFGAKVSSSRYAAYVEEHDTKEAWELDALEPDELDRMIRDNVMRHFDRDVYDQNEELVRIRRADMRTRMKDGEWFYSVIGDDGEEE